ncbi:IclR family transcriptional regulator [Frankia sp. CNm7]|uniref:IclR family transcriptional regulator n=1 Tax=Frankia nepalensis TaxID=1836974 RepID=A0A937RE91_9ACTN|nr:IclR family transcriptional regulator [Frankia nepalensis]MBL7498648.1 IclR family transcriptional regulator [Frankia nepalensis]MBL7509186.1 IclR family transcriptional regulator [Frankia nepalensis]MBL7522724.1 IclR family transcriptional regulator [Frankia nepalensis]MBL7628377.1 IclR family transcriptional regulator [Frankia nepalensis]
MSTVGRALSLLDAFSDGSASLRLTTIAARSGLPLPTTLRLARELVAWGGLERQADGSYRLGTRLWVLGGQVPCQRRLADAGRPYLRGLRTATGRAVALTSLDGDRLLIIDELDAPVSRGSHLPLHATAAGKLFLAHGPDALRQRVLSDLTRLTPYTVTAPGLLHRQFADIRGGSLAIAKEERHLGGTEIAAPVGPTGDGGPAAALSVIAPSVPAARRAVPLLAAAAAALTAHLTPSLSA